MSRRGNDPRDAIAQHVRNVVGDAHRDAANKPLLASATPALFMSESEILRFVEQDCGAEGFGIDVPRGLLLAVRWDHAGVAHVVKAYQFSEVGALS